MKKNKIIVKTNFKNYSIFIGRNILSKFSSILKKEKINFDKCLIVVDKNLPKKNLKILKKKIKSKTEVTYFNPSEKNKNFENVVKILNILFVKKFSRNDCLIALGGGITGDVVGFAASIYKRGLKFINIPSTLLSQVDSSIGGKTGVNNIYGKNLVGSFYQPDLVISDVSLLKTLPYREVVCGYAEIIKHALIKSKKNFVYLKKNYKEILKLKSPFIEKTILESCKIKKNIIQKDEDEKNLRKILNFGHTFAHAFESSLGYSRKLNHGEAVIIGMGIATKFSNLNNQLPAKDFMNINEHFNSLKLNLKFHKFFTKRDIKKICNFMKMDKKNNSNKINLILLRKIGRTTINKSYEIKKIEMFLKSLL
tara:strand:- start:646 stop:1743 length:1098 start_codon:yes stop_codon:yes gene_type:complete